MPSYSVLIVDLLGLEPGPDGQPSPNEIAAYIEGKGAGFHVGPKGEGYNPDDGRVHFFYCPALSSEGEIVDEASRGYDAVIAAATIVPPGAVFPRGGVRIGAGTGNMRSLSWGGGTGNGGAAPLMNTPGINSRATAQMVFKAILRARPKLPLGELHTRVVEGSFDTGRDLRDYPVRKLEGQRLAVIGFGNIGREVARLGQAFGMDVVVYARSRHREWIEARGLTYAATMADAARGADVVSVHIGLGPVNETTGLPVNTGLIGGDVFAALAHGAMVVNFDRGEVVDIAALGAALASGQVGDVAVDADIFVAGQEPPSGPLAPYLPLAREFGSRVLLLPHAVADTDHPSRLAGAKQAVDQIMDALLHRRLANVVGTSPEGFETVGARGNADILGPGDDDLRRLAGTPELQLLSEELEWLAQFVEALKAGETDADAGRGVLAATRVQTLLRKMALIGPMAGGGA